jgi:aminodeoxyfutalosine deaminase
MGYRKIQADGLFDGVKMDEKDDPRVLICDDSGVVKAKLSPRDAGDGIERLHGLLCPGFVNTHCHLELSHMQGVIPPGTGMIDFLLQVIGRREEGATNPLDAAREADRKMYEGGIVAVGDISNNISSLPIKAGSLLHYHTFVEVAGFNPSAAQARLQQAVQVYNGVGQVMGRENVSLVPHAPYSVSKALFEALNDKEQGGIMSIHNQESDAENAFYQSKEGDFLRLYDTLGLNLDFYTAYRSNSLGAWLPWMSGPAKLILVHDVATSAADVSGALSLARQRHQELFWCLCPGANRYIQEKMPPVSLLRDQGCVITLGTDSLASNTALNMLSEMRLIQQYFPEVSLAEILGWATHNGAQALNIAGHFGRFSPGSRPGVLLISGLEGERITGHTSVKRIA